MKIVADNNIPFLKGVFEPYAEVAYKQGESISRRDLITTDALIVRTRTKCSRELLEDTGIKFIATATIGTDHIDMDFCRNQGVEVVSAAGSNAWGVVQYVISAINLLRPFRKFRPQKMVAGVIGAGNVGERVAYTLGKLGYRVLRCDPPVRQMIADGVHPPVLGPSPVDRGYLTSMDYCEIEDLLSSSDIVTVHLPLQKDTRGYIGDDYISLLKSDALFINTSRGEVVDEDSLILRREHFDRLVLDVWSGEPSINTKLLKLADIATTHIAGYSLEGKVNATQMSVRALAAFFSIKPLMDFSIKTTDFDFVPSGRDKYETLSSLINQTFDMPGEDKKLREKPSSFEKLRSEYSYRREIPKIMYDIICDDQDS
ncbi:MAG: 4-phosphoerythronate dehydrogenase [Bacteroidales bacterium]|nr:4-phosphoerythronate dehydrogenase [Bacteroidales bacterium]MDD2425427.1 4-phosphoerythronate dehydrogenase [Bacteroidales bacterium]MDD3988882.1 4-phosphoerythronate dehydrogenase [Bacteroidales bacterium]MDD4638431.1 4-phosphoerythronate dehydrogenase [Bacteroidales bacterium]